MYSHIMKVLKKIEEIGFALTPKNRRDSKFFHVAVIFQRNKILSIGQNSFKTHPVARKYGHRNSVLHAEVAAIIRHGLDDCSGLNLAVLRVNRNNELAISKPCVHCQSIIDNVGFKKVFYTNEQGVWEQV